MSDDETDAGCWRSSKQTLWPRLQTAVANVIRTVNAARNRNDSLLRKVLKRVADASGRCVCKIHILQRT